MQRAGRRSAQTPCRFRRACRAARRSSGGMRPHIHELWIDVRKPSLQRLFPERAVCTKNDDWAGLLASGSNCWLPLPAIAPIQSARQSAVVVVTFVPGYSGGTATDLHRFPYSSPESTRFWRHPSRKSWAGSASPLRKFRITSRSAKSIDRKRMWGRASSLSGRKF